MQNSAFVHALQLALRPHSDLSARLSVSQIEQLAQHFELMTSWGKVHNLTRVESLSDSISRHYLDCLLGLSFLSPIPQVYDFGSGAGFPGLVAAVLWPQVRVTLVDASRKKCSFLQVAAGALSLPNVSVLHSRVEKLPVVDYALSRATFSLDFVHVATQRLTDQGSLALWISEEQGRALAGALVSLSVEIGRRFTYQHPDLGAREIWELRKLS